MPHLTVKTLSGEQVLFEASPGDSVANVKAKVYEGLGLSPASSLRMLYRGKELETGSSTLGDYHILGNIKYTLRAVVPVTSSPLSSADLVSAPAPLPALTAGSLLLTRSAKPDSAAPSGWPGGASSTTPAPSAGPAALLLMGTSTAGGGGAAAAYAWGGDTSGVRAVVDPSSDAAGHSLTQEAAKWRTQLAIMTAERDAARGEVDGMRARLRAAEERADFLQSQLHVIAHLAGAASGGDSR